MGPSREPVDEFIAYVRSSAARHALARTHSDEIRQTRRRLAGRYRLALLDQLDLRQQVLGHPQRGGVDQAALERDRALTRLRCLLHGRHDLAGPRDQPVIGENTSFASSIWLGWMHHLPSKPSTEARRAAAT